MALLLLEQFRPGLLCNCAPARRTRDMAGPTALELVLLCPHPLDRSVPLKSLTVRWPPLFTD
jgi:hypothetical protein